MNSKFTKCYLLKYILPISFLCIMVILFLYSKKIVRSYFICSNCGAIKVKIHKEYFGIHCNMMDEHRSVTDGWFSLLYQNEDMTSEQLPSLYKAMKGKECQHQFIFTEVTITSYDSFLKKTESLSGSKYVDEIDNLRDNISWLSLGVSPNASNIDSETKDKYQKRLAIFRERIGIILGDPSQKQPPP